MTKEAKPQRIPLKQPRGPEGLGIDCQFSPLLGITEVEFLIYKQDTHSQATLHLVEPPPVHEAATCFTSL